jgi:hypothetical protein
MRLPPELWCRTFEHVDADTLPNVSLTCRHFHSIARPLIFRSFRLCIDTDDSPDQSSNTARLDFYASDAIAPFVRNLHVYIDSQLGTDLVPPCPILDALPRFINARWLTCRGVDFTRFWIQQISTLPSLRYLGLIMCSPPPHTDSLRLLRIHTFINHHFGTTDPMVQYWLELMDPNHLQFLHTPFTPGLSSFFLATDNPYPFSSLHTISFYARQGTISQLRWSYPRPRRCAASTYFYSVIARRYRRRTWMGSCQPTLVLY